MCKNKAGRGTVAVAVSTAGILSIYIFTSTFMKKEASRRVFGFNDAKLVGIAELLHEFVSRDKKEFAGFGYSKESINELHKLIGAFLDKPTDSNLAQLQAEATLLKDTKAAELKTVIRSITSRAKLVYSETSPRYKRFGTKGLDEMTDDQLRTCGEQVEDVATEYLPDLTARGLTPQIIASVKEATAHLALAIKAQRKAISDRTIVTEERVIAANALYARTMELANAGKAIWGEQNQAKYKDYVLYDPSGSPVEKPAEPVM